MRANLRPLSGEASIFLDLLRLISSLAVLVSHMVSESTANHSDADGSLVNSPQTLEHFGRLGSTAVIVFFVLSGFVISYTSLNKRRDGWQYSQARLSRLYSVLIPALLVSAGVHYILLLVAPAVHDQYTRAPTLFRFLLAATFSNELWFFSAAPPINRPLWSLGYEFWYYLIFGLWFYRGQRKVFFIFPILAALIAGPKVMLLFPVWMMGCMVCYLPRLELKPSVAWVIIFLLLLLMVVEVSTLPLYPDPLVGHPPLFFSAAFISNYLTGFLIGAAVWLLPSINVSKLNPNVIPKFRAIGDLTFSIYLLHFPLIILFKGVYPWAITTADLIFIGLLVAASAAGLGLYLEKKRPFWNRLFEAIIKRIRNQVVLPSHPDTGN